MKNKIIAILVCILILIWSGFIVAALNRVGKQRLVEQCNSSKQEETILITDYLNNRVIEVDSNGTIVWKVGVNYPVDAERLENGNTLISEVGNGSVIEVDNNGNIVWNYATGVGTITIDAERLENGNTLMTDYKEVIEVDSADNIVWNYTASYEPYDIERLENGNTLLTEYSSGCVYEVDNDGNIVWGSMFWNWSYFLDGPYDADRLENGNTLITEFLDNRVIEVESNGAIVWQKDGLINPIDAERLENGNTLITDFGDDRVIEVDSNGTIVWEKTGLNRPVDAERISTENGDEEPLEGKIVTEGFEEDKMPPTDWEHLSYSNNTWDIGEGNFYAHSGNYGAVCHAGGAGEPQDEWLISPAFDFSSMNNIVLSFWWKSDYNKMVELDNFDVFVKVSIDRGSSWDTVWTSGDIGVFSSWKWYNSSLGMPISLDDYEDESNVRIAWHFYGEDTADFILDEILIVGIKKVPVLNLVNIKGGIGRITGELDNSGDVTPDNINWTMEIVLPDVGPLRQLFRGLLFSPQQKEWETTDTKFSLNMFGVGRATVNIGYNYTIDDPSGSGVDVKGVREVDVRGLFILLNIIQQPERTWVKIDPQDVVYEESQSPPFDKVVRFYFDVETWHNVRVHDSDSSDILFQGSCSFNGESSVLKESFITKATVITGNAYWEVELVDGE